MNRLVATAAVLGFGNITDEVFDADPMELAMWEQRVFHASHEAHQRDRSHAAMVARAVWGKG